MVDQERPEAMERMLGGCRPGAIRVRLEPVGARVEQAATATETALAKLLAQDLSGLDLVALMVDGVHFGENCCVVALGIDALARCALWVCVACDGEGSLATAPAGPARASTAVRPRAASGIGPSGHAS